VAIVGGIAGLTGATLLYVRRNRKDGCDEEHARWLAAEALYEEATKAVRQAREEELKRQERLDDEVTIRDGAVKKWGEAQAPEYDARVVQEWAMLDAAKEAHEAATERYERLDAERQEARRIYEECIGQAAAVASTTTVAGPPVASGPAPR
jgi:hypothetical protein